MVFWKEMAAASAACRADPPAASTTAAAAMAPAAPISTWQPATSAAKVALLARISPTAAAARSERTTASGASLHSSAMVTMTPGMTPAEPPVGAAQTIPELLETCMAARARAAARAWSPPAARVPARSARQSFWAVGRRSCIRRPRPWRPASTDSFMTR